MILDSLVDRARGAREAVRWQGAPTKWATAHEEKQRSQRAVSRVKRVCSATTQVVLTVDEGDVRGHRSSQVRTSGQLRNQG